MTHLKNNLRAIQLIAIPMFTVLSVHSSQAQTPKKSGVGARGSVAGGQRPVPPRLFPWSLAPDTSHLTPAAGPSLQVFGSGTLGRLTKWTGFTSSNSTIGDSTIFEDKFGLVGIGTDSPTSKFTVAGMIQTTLGGYKFPDGTIQTTAGLFSVFHDATLTGNGTSALRLGVAIPLDLTGSGSPIHHV